MKEYKCDPTVRGRWPLLSSGLACSALVFEQSLCEAWPWSPDQHQFTGQSIFLLTLSVASSRVNVSKAKKTQFLREALVWFFNPNLGDTEEDSSASLPLPPTGGSSRTVLGEHLIIFSPRVKTEPPLYLCLGLDPGQSLYFKIQGPGPVEKRALFNPPELFLFYRLESSVDHYNLPEKHFSAQRRFTLGFVFLLFVFLAYNFNIYKGKLEKQSRKSSVWIRPQWGNRWLRMKNR